MCAHVYIHTYVYIDTYMYIYIHTYTYVYARVRVAPEVVVKTLENIRPHACIPIKKKPLHLCMHVYPRKIKKIPNKISILVYV